MGRRCLLHNRLVKGIVKAREYLINEKTLKSRDGWAGQDDASIRSERKEGLKNMEKLAKDYGINIKKDKKG